MNEEKLTVGSLFTGIGGFDLGLEMTGGFKIAFQVEINEHCQGVLGLRWPDTPRYGDICECGADAHYAGDHQKGPDSTRRSLRLPGVDVLCGGFPCQDISLAGKRAGINEGERSGLWSEFFRLICELHPRYVLIENVAALLAPIRRDGIIVEPAPIARVLGELASVGYDAEWQVISAAAVGAPHRRDRVFIVAYPQCSQWGQGESCGDVSHGEDARWQQTASGARALRADGGTRNVADAAGAAIRLAEPGDRGQTRQSSRYPQRTLVRPQDGETRPERPRSRRYDVADAAVARLAQRQVFDREAGRACAMLARLCRAGTGQWASEPPLDRVVDGLPDRVDELKGLGNAIVPHVAALVGLCLLRYHRAVMRDLEEMAA